MSTVPNNTQSPTARRAQMMREAWHPVGQRLSGGYRRTQNFLVAHPALAQGIYYVLTGLWPWVHMRSFLLVTGSKTDLWLVQTVGALIAVIGIVLCLASYFREVSRTVLCLAVGSAAALAMVDVVFVFQRRIPPVYMLDAVLEVGLIGLWVYSWRTGNILFVREQVVAAVAASEVPAAAPPAAPAQPGAVPAWIQPVTQTGVPQGQPMPGTQQTYHQTPVNETVGVR